MSSTDRTPAPAAPHQRRGVLDWIEWAGNKLPEPAILFAILAGIIIVVSGVGSAMKWSVQPVQPRMVMVEKVGPDGAPVLDEAGKPLMTPKLGPDGRPEKTLVETGAPITPRSLMTTEGVYWMLSSMLRNFTHLPALGLIFVAMLGIGLAEKFGFFSALMRFLAFVSPRWLLTPVIVLIGSNSSVASDAGYIILPPLAAALYAAMGRPPIAGLAAAFAGVAGGFGGGFFPTGGDGALTGFAQDAARVIDPGYTVNMLHNLYFKSGSAIIVMLAGWFVTDRIIEPRLVKARGASAEPTDADVLSEMSLTAVEKRALMAAMLTKAAVLGVFGALILIPGAPLHGYGQPTLADGRVLMHHAVTIAAAGETLNVPASDVLAREPLMIAEAPQTGRLVESPGSRWSHVIVPVIFFVFLFPGMVYGLVTGALRTQKDFIEGIYHGIRSIVPVLAIAFFMSQFVAYFAYTKLDRMLAYSGGAMLVEADMPVMVLLALFVLIVIFGDFALSGMLSKFGVLAPIFIPMFMMVGMSPELTTAAYRIGDSVVNIITPLNSYLLIILAVLQKYKKDAGLGSLISLMLPYSVIFFFVWTGFLLVWYAMGWPLGVDAPLEYTPPQR
ncbi:MAG: AbgT family transporter [Planctomycetota bacterium]|nr:AbgT family transporter [Planctomycetota bacterium]